MMAEDFFEWVRQCRKDKQAAELRLRHPYVGRSSSSMVAGGHGTSDPMAGVDAALDRESELHATISRCDHVLRIAQGVICEVWRGVPGPAATILELYYLDGGNTWEEIAFELHVSLSTVYRVRREAMEWVNWSGIVADIGRDR